MGCVCQVTRTAQRHLHEVWSSTVWCHSHADIISCATLKENTNTYLLGQCVKYTEHCLAYNTCSVKLIVSMGDRQRVLRLLRGYGRVLRENIKLRPEKNIVEDLKTSPHLPCSLGKLTCFLPSTEHIGCCPKLMARRPCYSYFNQYSTNPLTTRPSDSRLKSIQYKNNCQQSQGRSQAQTAAQLYVTIIHRLSHLTFPFLQSK